MNENLPVSYRKNYSHITFGEQISRKPRKCYLKQGLSNLLQQKYQKCQMLGKFTTGIEHIEVKKYEIFHTSIERDGKKQPALNSHL